MKTCANSCNIHDKTSLSSTILTEFLQVKKNGHTNGKLGQWQEWAISETKKCKGTPRTNTKPRYQTKMQVRETRVHAQLSSSQRLQIRTAVLQGEAVVFQTLTQDRKSTLVFPDSDWQFIRNVLSMQHLQLQGVAPEESSWSWWILSEHIHHTIISNSEKLFKNFLSKQNCKKGASIINILCLRMEHSEDIQKW